jgi:ADP-heptose:LPS heptosyltransferase
LSPELERIPAGARFAIVRLRSLGDCVLSTPAIHLLKRHRPDLEIGVVVEDRFAEVYAGNPDVSHILPPRAAALAAFRPRLVLNLHGGPRSLALTLASLAPRRAGFAHYRAAWLYNIRIPTAQEVLGLNRKVHTAEHAASAMFYLGVPPQEIPRARLAARPSPRAGAYAVIHPFASSPDKTWPAERFAAVARNLGTDVVVVGSPHDDFAPFLEFEIACGSLAETSALLAGASLFIGNDSGPAHMAAAHGVPVVVLFGPSDEVVWGPWRTRAQVIKSPDLTKVEVNRVLGAVAALEVRA